MQQSITTPRSIQGIKHTAAKLKRSLSLKTHEAQDLAAQQAGYANFKAARDTLPEKAFQVSLSCRWLDTITHLRGNETLTLHLTRPWFQISCPNAPHKANGHLHLEKDSTGNLSYYSIAGSQSHARSLICSTARSLLFAEATGLMRASSKKGWPRKKVHGLYGNYMESVVIPGNDHEKTWMDPVSGEYVLSDEPYMSSIRLGKDGIERAKWCKQHGFKELMLTWPGIHNPKGGTRMFLITKAGNSIDLQKLEKLSRHLPIDISEDDWKGTSQIFESPIKRQA